MFRQIHPVRVRRYNGNGYHQRRPQAIRRPIDWQDRKEVEAMVLFSFGFSWKQVEIDTGVPKYRLMTLAKKAGIGPTQYRNRAEGTTGGRVAAGVLHDLRKQYRPLVERALPAPRPANKRSPEHSSNLASSNGR